MGGGGIGGGCGGKMGGGGGMRGIDILREDGPPGIDIVVTGCGRVGKACGAGVGDEGGEAWTE